MRTSIIKGTIFAAAIGLSAPALAQEAAPTSEFEGFYIGATTGYGFQPNDGNATVLFDRNLDGRFGDTVVTTAGANAFSPGFCGGAARGNNAAAGCTNDRSGFTYSGRLGYDIQRGRIVVGIVGEVGDSLITDSVAAFSTTPASYTLTRSVNLEGGVRGRAGFAFGKTLLFATAGLGIIDIKRTFATSNTANSFINNGDEIRVGGQFGGGIEQKLGKHFSIGVEYLHHRYNDTDFRVRVGPGTAPATNPFLLAGAGGTDFARSDNRFNWNTVRATVAYRF
ncbi:MAG: hypothetical protein C0500_02185 [Sphingobium sp.]|nr:hypothetical protein [Sphingobium sp.]